MGFLSRKIGVEEASLEDLLDEIERRSGPPSASDPITADHWIVQRIQAMNASGYVVDGTNALRQTAVYACVRVLAETIASLPLYLYERGEGDTKEPAREHDLWPILHDSPNNFQTAFEDDYLPALKDLRPGLSRFRPFVLS